MGGVWSIGAVYCRGMFSEGFCAWLDRFFGQLLKYFRYAIEIRNPWLLGPEYQKMLESHGIAHVYNHWFSMSSLADRSTSMQGFTAVFTVLRLLTLLKMPYEAAKKRAEPYPKIVEELSQMRRETVQLVRQAVSEGRHADMLVNNRRRGMRRCRCRHSQRCFAPR